MTLNSSWSPSWLTKAARALGRGLSGAALLAAAGTITAGCLQRPVAPAKPQTTNVYINQIRSTGVDKIDLLFMIDNSISMSDKQQILADAVPVLVQRLISPTCVNTMGNAGQQNPDGSCPNGYAPEFKPIKNIHVGIITSSLGDHGSNDVCSDAQNDANVASGGTRSNYNDLAQLLPSVRQNLVSWNNSGFLVWDPRNQSEVLPEDRHANLTMNETNAMAFGTAFHDQVVAADQHGCGYESSLEAWYRFLVDPEPVSTLSHNDMTSVTVRPKDAMGNAVINQTVLKQRHDFMRLDSLLAIVMLSDENDCSIVDEDDTQGWLVGYKGGVNSGSLWHMPRSSSACAGNPNDPCCRPCISAPSGSCPGNDTDPACSMGSTLSLNEDSMNMRCFNQVRRFGIDLLYPTDRYVEGLSKPLVHPRYGGPAVPNPIYNAENGNVPREPGLVFFAGLVGVPWQDVATPESWGNGRKLEYLKADDLATPDPNTGNSRWDVILGGRPEVNGGLPLDTLMVESIDPRNTQPYPQVHPLLPGNVMVGSPTATTLTNPINGHEQAVAPFRDDLQFACTFPLSKQVTCTADNADACDCNYDEFVKNSPLCTGVTMTTDGTQTHAKAYPGVRHLQVLKGYGSNSIVASICPKNIDAAGGSKTQDPDYGYNPAVAAIVDRLKEALTVKCLPRPLTPVPKCGGEVTSDCTTDDADVGKVPCAVLEVRPTPDSGCEPCSNPTGRQDLSGDTGKAIESAAKEYLKNVGYCVGAACDQYCFCRINQFTDQDPDGNTVDANKAGGPDLTECKTTPQDPGNLYGYCYVDPANEPDADLAQKEQALVQDCKSSEKRILRFLGENLPAKDGLAFIACVGGAAHE